MRLALLPLLLAVLLAAGCDVGVQDPKPTYNSQVREVLDRFAKAYKPANSDLSDVPKLGREIQRGAASLNRAARGLAALKPPAELRTLHGEAVAAFRNQGELYSALAEELLATPTPTHDEATDIVARYSRRLAADSAKGQLTIERLASEVN